MRGNILLLLVVLIPTAAAFIAYMAGRRGTNLRNFTVFIAVAMTFGMSCYLAYGVWQNKSYTLSIPDFCGMGLHLTLDGFRALYCVIASLMWLMTAVFSFEYFERSNKRHGDSNHNLKLNRYYLFNLLTLGVTLGVLMAADFFTMFIFFEIMSLTSYPMVAHEEDERAIRAAETYLAVAVFGGMVMLMGIFILYSTVGTLEISALKGVIGAIGEANDKKIYLAGALMLVGFGAKAGVFPLHIWLPKAHPVAPAPASAILSGMLTKTGVFGVIAISCNMFLGEVSWGIPLFVLGIVTMLLGAILALLSVDLKRTLACSSVSQIGFIIVGIAMQSVLGTHNALAVRGTVLCMLNHSMIKLILFMSAGVIYMNTHKLKLNDMRGYGRGKPLLTAVFLLGALSIAGIPGTSGYISKTLLHESIIEGIHMLDAGTAHSFLQIGEILFVITGGLTVAYMCKLFITIFIEKGSDNSKKKEKYISKLSTVALALPTVLLLVTGIMTKFAEGIAEFAESFMYGHAPEYAIRYFEWINLKGAVFSVAIGAAVYMLICRGLLRKQQDGTHIYMDAWPSKLDLENLLFRPFVNIVLSIFIFLARLLAPFGAGGAGRFYEKYYYLFNPPNPQEKTAAAKHAPAVSFSFGLLLLGVGICVVLVFEALSAVL